MLKLNILILGLCCFLDVCVGQVIQNGQCASNPSVVQNFNIERYLGSWRLLESYYSSFQEGACNGATYSAGTDGSIVVFNSKVQNQQLVTITGSAVLATTDGSGKLLVTFPSGATAELLIVDTDYDTYALLYSCENISTERRSVWSWKLSRTKQLSTAANIAINNAMANIDGLSSMYYQIVDQSDQACFYYPEVVSGEPVIFPGQCGTITGMANFNLNRFLGSWRLIESYYSAFQVGACNGATYSAGTGSSIVVVNSKVLNQQLVTITGSAVLATTDGTGKLVVTFPSGATAELVILDIDYDSYAVLYSCENINTNSRQVTSWKFSRTNQLSTAANTAINNAIANIDVLDNMYYEKVDQSDQACFYMPEVAPGEPVIFPGQCASVTGMANFNLNGFLGSWRLIESYYSAFQVGACNGATYSAGTGSSIVVVNSKVLNQQLVTITGSAVLATTDGTGKLVVTFPSGATAELVILDTDYDSYALLYSCENINTNSRQVTSWKFSRTNQLSTAANTAINNAIANIDVLDNMYYEKVDQSDQACFYMPEVAPGEPVIFPGQCASVTGMANFNLNRFLGSWRLIESYYSAFQVGACNGATYSAGTGSSIVVVNSKVLNQQLVTITGSAVLATTDGTGKLVVTFPSGATAELVILDTDYDSYAVLYSCENINTNSRQVTSWKFSRTNQLSTAANTAINNAIANIDVLDNMYYEKVDQSDQACFYMPEVAPGEPVIFPGQCATNIRGVSNFNINRYLGSWRLIESYYSAFQVGACNGATYSTDTTGSYVVVNSKVLNQQLVTITGSTVLATTDGSGTLLITFPSGASAELVILDTDYDSYALLYNCENISTNTRQVTSWKMSRTKELSTAASTAINNVVANIDVLNDIYYQKVDQSDQACFYYPEPAPGEPVIFPGQCASITGMPNFNLNRYLGSWRLIESYYSAFQVGACNSATYSTDTTGSVVVVNSKVQNQQLVTITGSTVLATTDGTGTLLITFPSGASAELVVLDTDYDSYALLYNCENISTDSRRVTSWKMSRTKQLTTAGTTAINNAIANIDVLDNMYYEIVDQSDQACFYIPELVPGEPVVFPGQCATSITGVQNFNLNRYLGSWRLIESYYSAFQVGACNGATYSAGTGSSIVVVNSKVLNQQLVTITGSAVLATTDGSGKLLVVFPSGATAELVILDTDYDSYALLYHCENIGTDSRQVTSWKMSRTRQLSAAANTAINNVVANIDVLDNSLYENVDQSDAACFYLPELAPTDPVIFPGQCANNITGMPNFNLFRYSGRWRLIESYFTHFQVGTCNEATYTADSIWSAVVTNSKVVNQQLETITGSAALATDGSGKLLITFPSGATSDLVILDTDYDSYALLYSCENLSTETRRVWSWKMSRTNSLPSAASFAINSIVDSIDVLNDRYYQTIDRSDASCFYYPTPDVNNPVVFRGQCDLTIPTVANFNVLRYLGAWYDVESYPALTRNGTCNNALYTLNADGSIRVQNNQVVDQGLQSSIGSAVVTSTDGSAKLDVTFNVNVTAKYWVLATDYDSYAFVYSCVNIDEETRSVYSRKLSRTPTLSAASNTAINTVINSIPVLDQRYYVQRSHSEEDCFYYPDNNGGDVILDGQCLDDGLVQAVTNFDTSLFAGTWHEVSRFPSGIQDTECISTNFTLSGTNTFVVDQVVVDNERLRTTTIQASLPSNNRGVLSVNINGVPFNNVYILATDYSEYALAYSCRNIDNERKQIYSWKLSRSRSGLSAAANTVIDQVVRENDDLWERYYRPTGQDNDSCFYYPVFEQTPSYIELPGPCPDIRGVPNFNITAYLGTWYETARYPVPTQRGTCNRAEYSTVVGDPQRYTASRAEVRGTSLARRSGNLELVSTDGSGQLSIEFIISGAPRVGIYYILDTDYTSYSLLYTCRDLENGNRRVGSWKFSRTRIPTSEASAAIDNLVNNTQGLLEEYYQPTDQSDDACFYIPSVNTQAAPLFRGQCEDITGVQGFDVQRYLGWWHEIERYPIDTSAGECRSSEYEQDGNTYGVIDNRVQDNEGVYEPGTITATSDGRLRRSMLGGDVEDIWVLATDYTSYALLYSCVNVEGREYRRVWSAKHSKTRSLTEAAQTAMAPIINNNRVLYDRFYLTVNQSDATCFHYPNATNGQVIIPGQCDSNIPVVQDFNINDFAGTWYHIESYETANSSSCVGSNYDVNESSGTINVVNFEVVDGELSTVEGSAAIESDDDSAKISLTFPAADSQGAANTISVSILTTDYRNYAVAYNCVNINAYQRQVRTWKLSRERTLSSASSTTINALIQQRQELHQPYFNQIEQRADCPEPSSAFIIKSSIIVLLMCAISQWFL